MMNEDIDSSEDEEFSWDEYLQKTNSEAAPTSCFCQNPLPPKNEFRIGHKLETFDPRNTSSTCIASIIEIAGPRMRLRLDGTDDRNDFWLMCDSEFLHPFEYSARMGRKISPPLGFGNELSKWPKFLERIINQSIEKGLFAPVTCFKEPPPKLSHNNFKIGQKLEAVDPKNPHLICPATIKDINKDKLFISFDGWSQSSQFWVSFTSRDLFPVGWCKKAGHLLQEPGNLEEKTPQSLNITSSNNISIGTRRISSSNLGTLNKKTKSSQSNSKSNKSNKKQKLNHKANASSNSSNNSSINSSLNNSSTSNSSNLNVTNDTLNSPHKQQSNSKSHNNKNQQENSKNEQVNLNDKYVDLSLVKTEAIDYDDEYYHANSSFSQNGEQSKNKLNETTNIVKSANGVTSTSSKVYHHNVIVYVNPYGDCGEYIKTPKFHKSHTKFGPGLPSHVYKSIIQSFVDCAVNRYNVFQMIPEGKSNLYVKLMNSEYNQRKIINQVDNETDLWLNIKDFCKYLKIDEKQLFANKPFEAKQQQNNLFLPANNSYSSKNATNNVNNNGSSNKNNQLVLNTNSNDMPLTPQPSSSSSISSTSSHLDQLQNVRSNNGNHNHSNKTRLSSQSNDNNRLSEDITLGEYSNQHDSQSNYMNKCSKTMNESNSSSSSSLFPVNEWSIDQVVNYISKLSDNYFASYVDLFRHHEIDGKALLLLTTEILMKYMGFKLGPALKLNNYLEKLRQQYGVVNTIKISNSSANLSANTTLDHLSTKTESSNYY